jgi:hypothetical protein
MGSTERGLLMRKRFWVGIALSLCAACSDRSTGAPATSGSAGAAPVADAGPPPLLDVVRDEVALYDRRIHAACPCLVAQGTYSTEDECLKVGLSGPSWVDCATMALASYDNPTTRAQSQCYFDFLRDAAACTEAAHCDAAKLANCGNPDPDCLASQNERVTLLLTACPDFGLLSRVSR